MAFQGLWLVRDLMMLPGAWCERGDLNPHGLPLDPKSSASANSATLALTKEYIYHKFHVFVNIYGNKGDIWAFSGHKEGSLSAPFKSASASSATASAASAAAATDVAAPEPAGTSGWRRRERPGR